jgi:hypothetical protein
MYRKPNTATTIKVRKMDRAGHLARTSDGRTVKTVFLGKPDGRRKAGRPKLRWWACTENGLKEMEEESRRRIRMGCHSEGGTGSTVRAAWHSRRRRRRRNVYGHTGRETLCLPQIPHR